MGRVYDILTGQPRDLEPEPRTFNERLSIGIGSATALGGLALVGFGDTLWDNGDTVAGIPLTVVGLGIAVLAFRKVWNESSKDSLSGDEYAE